MYKFLVMLCVAAGLFRLMGTPAAAHDVFNNLRSPTGQLCCGGDPVTGDCEALGPDDYRVGPSGVVIHSKRYGTTVEIGPDKIVWQGVPGSDAPVHWCGVPRTKTLVPTPTPDNPDPTYYTFCAFISPGGS